MVDNRYGAEASNDTGSPIGGGAGYYDIFTQNDPRITITVTTRDQLLNAIASATSGDVIFIPSNVSIDLSYPYIDLNPGVNIPGGITIASDRGYGGSLGGRIFQIRPSYEPKTSIQRMFTVTGNNVRITGLRLEGSNKDQLSAGYIVRYGIIAGGRKGFEVDNCEIFGWGYAGVSCGVMEWEAGITPYIHHNSIHHNQHAGLGYGVLVNRKALIEANIFNYCRHDIAGAGGSTAEDHYEARYNIFSITSSQLSHQCDMHNCPSDVHDNPPGGSMYIHHNTFRHTGNQYGSLFGCPPARTSYCVNNIHAGSTSRACHLRYGKENVLAIYNMVGGTLRTNNLVVYGQPEAYASYPGAVNGIIGYPTLAEPTPLPGISGGGGNGGELIMDTELLEITTPPYSPYEPVTVQQWFTNTGATGLTAEVSFYINDELNQEGENPKIREFPPGREYVNFTFTRPTGTYKCCVDAALL
jgi:hypothetical protein